MQAGGPEAELDSKLENVHRIGAHELAEDVEREICRFYAPATEGVVFGCRVGDATEKPMRMFGAERAVGKQHGDGA